MTQRTALIAAAAITAFILIVIGGIVGRMSGQAVGDAGASDPLANAQASTGDREAAYQQALAEANQRIEQANAQLEEAYRAQQDLSAQLAEQAAPGAGAYAITGEQAGQIAMEAIPGAQLARQPELVSYQGTPAYEVVLDLGTVYVDADRGQVLSNDSAQEAFGREGGWSESEADEEHEHEHR